MQIIDNLKLLRLINHILLKNKRNFKILLLNFTVEEKVKEDKIVYHLTFLLIGLHINSKNLNIHNKMKKGNP